MNKGESVVHHFDADGHLPGQGSLEGHGVDRLGDAAPNPARQDEVLVPRDEDGRQASVLQPVPEIRKPGIIQRRAGRVMDVEAVAVETDRHDGVLALEDVHVDRPALLQVAADVERRGGRVHPGGVIRQRFVGGHESLQAADPVPLRIAHGGQELHPEVVGDLGGRGVAAMGVHQHGGGRREAPVAVALAHVRHRQGRIAAGELQMVVQLFAHVGDVHVPCFSRRQDQGHGEQAEAPGANLHPPVLRPGNDGDLRGAAVMDVECFGNKPVALQGGHPRRHRQDDGSVGGEFRAAGVDVQHAEHGQGRLVAAQPADRHLPVSRQRPRWQDHARPVGEADLPAPGGGDVAGRPLDLRQAAQVQREAAVVRALRFFPQREGGGRGAGGGGSACPRRGAARARRPLRPASPG